MVPVFAMFIQFSYGQAIPLYEKVIPNSKKAPADYVEHTDSSGLIWNVTQPTLTPFLPAKGMGTGTAVIICPGGGYTVVASMAKSALIAKAFNDIGVTAFVLTYRLPSDAIMVDKTIGPLQDLETAMLILRSRAAEWGIDPKKVGVVGVSAGGHIASTLGTHFEKPVIENKAQISLRPDFLMLIYPVIVFDPNIPSGTREKLIGTMPSKAVMNYFSNEKHVTAKTPPTFLVHAADDDVVPAKNSLLFFEALQKAKVNTEIHIFQVGGHGFGLGEDDGRNKWFDWGKHWLKENGF